MPQTEQTTQQVHEEALTRSFRLNYWTHIIEGGMYMGGLSFIAGGTVMPSVLKSLGGPNWLISLTPQMMVMGFVLFPLLVAHRIERLERVKPLIVLTGFFQRIPFLLSAIMLFWYVDSYPLTTLIVVALAPLVSGLVGGMTAPAWFELVARTIPAHRRASVWAYRMAVCGTIGLFAGGIVTSVLTKYPGPTGYGILHLIVFAFLMASYVAFLIIREVPSPEPPAINNHRVWHNLKSIPTMVRNDARLRNCAIMRVAGTGVFILVPFLAIHAQIRTGRSVEYVGLLLAAQMAGSICGSLMGGFIGDRYGGKILVVVARFLVVGICMGTAVNVSHWGFMGSFFTLGVALTLGQMGEQTLNIEISPLPKRPTYMALLSTLSFPSLLIAGALATLMRWVSGEFWPTSMVTAICMIVSLIFLKHVREPRSENNVSIAG